MNAHLDLGCADVNELAAAYALGAVDPDEELAVSEHLSTCPRPHADARDMIEGASLVAASLPSVTASAHLRDRLMATAAATPQEQRPLAAAGGARDSEPSRPWWQLSPLPSALAAVALALAVGLGAWGLSLNAQLAERDAALRAVASADAAYVAQGEAGNGWVIESGGRAMFMADDLADLGAGQLYELWLIDAEGTAVAAGTLTDTDGMALVTLEQPIGDAVTFAMTVETERVEQSQNDPVMVAAIGA
jgi:anti-sigma-K factor RskA